MGQPSQPDRAIGPGAVPGAGPRNGVGPPAPTATPAHLEAEPGAGGSTVEIGPSHEARALVRGDGGQASREGFEASRAPVPVPPCLARPAPLVTRIRSRIRST